jgi:hypothetical protein
MADDSARRRRHHHNHTTDRDSRNKGHQAPDPDPSSHFMRHFMALMLLERKDWVWSHVERDMRRRKEKEEGEQEKS